MTAKAKRARGRIIFSVAAEVVWVGKGAFVDICQKWVAGCSIKLIDRANRVWLYRLPGRLCICCQCATGVTDEKGNFLTWSTQLTVLRWYPGWRSRLHIFTRAPGSDDYSCSRSPQQRPISLPDQCSASSPLTCRAPGSSLLVNHVEASASHPFGF
jgi:hypothetical protein